MTNGHWKRDARYPYSLCLPDCLSVRLSVRLSVSFKSNSFVHRKPSEGEKVRKQANLMPLWNARVFIVIAVVVVVVVVVAVAVFQTQTQTLTQIQIQIQIQILMLMLVSLERREIQSKKTFSKQP